MRSCKDRIAAGNQPLAQPSQALLLLTLREERLEGQRRCWGWPWERAGNKFCLGNREGWLRWVILSFSQHKIRSSCNLAKSYDKNSVTPCCFTHSSVHFQMKFKLTISFFILAFLKSICTVFPLYYLSKIISLDSSSVCFYIFCYR